MRLVALACVGLALIVPSKSPAAAQVQGTLDRNETLLEIQSEGVSRTRADVAMVKVPLVSKGTTAAEARAANATLARRVWEAAISAGAAPNETRIVPPGQTRIGFVGNEALELMRAGEPAEVPHMAMSIVEVRVRNPSIFEALRRKMEEAGASNVPDLEYSLSDDVAQRRAAKADAIRRAREEASAYAQSLGMSVGRVLRVSERSTPNVTDVEGYQEMYRMMAGANRYSDGTIETRVRVSVDFALMSPR
jgi:uncharacterized protein YggE